MPNTGHACDGAETKGHGQRPLWAPGAGDAQSLLQTLMEWVLTPCLLGTVWWALCSGINWRAESLQAGLPITFSEPGTRGHAWVGWLQHQPKIHCHPHPGFGVLWVWAGGWGLMDVYCLGAAQTPGNRPTVPIAGGDTIWVRHNLVEYQEKFSGRTELFWEAAHSNRGRSQDQG